MFKASGEQNLKQNLTKEKNIYITRHFYPFLLFTSVEHQKRPNVLVFPNINPFYYNLHTYYYHFFFNLFWVIVLLTTVLPKANEKIDLILIFVNES